MTIFLTGSSGLLGNALASAFLDNRWEVHGSVYRQSSSLPGLAAHPVNLADSAALRFLLDRIRPTAILNAAALSRPAECEANPELSKALNVNLPAELASYAKTQGVRFIHFSTDMVFNGQTGNYSEDSPVNPTNLYGKHKLESEYRIQEINPEACIIRLPLLMGNSPSGLRSVHETHWAAWQKNEVTPLFEDEWRTPVSVSNVAELSGELVRKPSIQGLLHWAGATRLNRWDIGRQIAGKFGVSESLLQKSRACEDSRFKDRPLDLTLNISKLKSQVETEPAPFESQLAEIDLPKT
jgi:dTDP-4-dehydrorhamnose reductase